MSAKIPRGRGRGCSKLAFSGANNQQPPDQSEGLEQNDGFGEKHESPERRPGKTSAPDAVICLQGNLTRRTDAVFQTRMWAFNYSVTTGGCEKHSQQPQVSFVFKKNKQTQNKTQESQFLSRVQLQLATQKNICALQNRLFFCIVHHLAKRRQSGFT